jgi:MoxR-like ATPase
LLVGATRQPALAGAPELAPYITCGASPRATIGLIEGAKAMALLRGRTYALTEDMTELVHDVFRHRVVLSYEALAEGLTPDSIVQRLMQAVQVPDQALATAP